MHSHKFKFSSYIQGGVTYFASIFKLTHRQREAGIQADRQKGGQAGCLVKRLATRMVLSLCHCIQSVIFAWGGINSSASRASSLQHVTRGCLRGLSAPRKESVYKILLATVFRTEQYIKQQGMLKWWNTIHVCVSSVYHWYLTTQGCHLDLCTL